MPIVDVEIVAPSPGGVPSARALADALGAVFGSPAGSTWVRLRCLAADGYAENGVGEGATPRPVFVTVTASNLPPPARRAVQARQVAEVVARVSGRPPVHVHVEYALPAAGRIAFGGKLPEFPDA